jgi:hypothetical protein
VIKSLVSVGVAPVPAGVPARLATAIVHVTKSVFTSGMNAAFAVAAAVALGGVLIALLTRPAAAEHGHGHG